MEMMWNMMSMMNMMMGGARDSMKGHIYIYIYVYIHIHIYILYACMHTCLWIYTCTCTYDMYVCINS